MPKDTITTKFAVDISDLKKGITEANNQIKLANAQFKNASAGMDNWAKSSEGIKAKLSQLQSTLDAQNQKLKAYQEQLKLAQKYQKEAADNVSDLKTALAQAKSEFGDNSEEVKKLERQLTEAEKAELAMKRQVESLTISCENQEGAVKATSKQMDDLADDLKKVEAAEKLAEKTGKSFDEALEQIEGSSKKASDGFTVMKGALANLVADGIRKAIDAAKEFASTMIQTAAEVKAETSQFEQTFGAMGGEAEKAIKQVADSTGILDTRLKGSATQIYAFAKASGADTAQAMSLMETSLAAAADSAAYYDKSLEESTETLQSFLKGNFENDAALGVSATEFTRNAKATELFGQKYNDLTEIQKQQTLLQMVVDAQKASGAFGQASRESDGWENVMGNLNESWRQFKALVGTPFLEAIIPVIQSVTQSFQEWTESVDWEDFSEKVKEVTDAIKTGFGWLIENGATITSIISGIVAGFVAFKAASIIMTVVSALQTLFTLISVGVPVVTALNVAMNANPIMLIVTAIVGLVTAFITLWNTSEEFRNFWINLWETIKTAARTVIDAIATFFSNVWTKIKEIVGSWIDFFFNVWNTIKTVWSEVVGFFRGIFDKVSSTIKKIFNDLPGFFSNIWNKIVGLAKSFGTKIGDTIGGAIKSAINAVLNFVETKINQAIDLINGAIGLINKLPGVSVGTIGHVSLPRLAKGGVLDRGARAVIAGEAGAEAVVPLERNRYWISKVANEMMRQLSATPSVTAGNITNSTNNFTQIINAPKQPSRIELYRQTKNLLNLKGI